MAENEHYQVILEKVAEERQPETALFLSGCFSLPPPATRGIAAAGPIALVSGMTKPQGESVMNELSTSLPKGVVLRLASENESAKVSRLQWPRPPRIYGRDLGDFADDIENVETVCPHCGGALSIRNNPGGDVEVAPAGLEKRRVSSRRLPSASDKDPLFSGVKPLASTTDLASLRSLNAGDTGFWMDHDGTVFSPPGPSSEDVPDTPGGASSANSAKKSTSGKSVAGLAAFMKPGAFSLVVGRSRDSQVVKMIAEIMGLSEDEARDRCLNLGLCVAHDISLDEAQNLLARFKTLGAKARIVKPS